MMKFKKIMALSLAAMMTLSAVACGAKDEPTDTKPAESSEKAESTASSEAESSAPEEEELEFVTIKFMNGGTKPESGNHDKVWAKINEMLKEDLNCEVVVEYGGERKEFALKYAANEVWDFGFDASWFGYADNAAANAYREITMEEIQEYMPLVYEQLPEIGWEQSKIDGKIYMIPNVNYEYGMGTIMIRGDLREKYGLDPVETVDDYIEYLKVIAENEKDMEAVGFTSHLGVVFNREYYGTLPVGGGFDYVVYEDENLDTSPTIYSRYLSKDDHLLEYYKLMRQFYEWGVWKEDAISDSTKSTVKFENGLSASEISNITTCNSTAKKLMEEHPDWKIEIVAPNYGTTYANSFTSNGCTINRNSENPERAMMVLNLFMADPEYNYLLNYGFEGINYEINENGEKISIAAEGDDAHNCGRTWQFQNTVIGLPAADDYEGVAEIKQRYIDNTLSFKLQAFVLDKSNIQTETANVSAVNTEYNAMEYGMIEDVEGTYNEWKEALLAAGLQTMIDECQRQVDEFLGK